MANPARFVLTRQTLSDKSVVYGVRFFDDYDPDIRIEVDCIDRAHAQRLIDALEGTSCIGVIVPESV